MKYLITVTLCSLLLLGCTPSNSNNRKNNTASTLTGKATTPLPFLHLDTTFTFETKTLDTLPQNWSQYATGRDNTTQWKIIDDDGNKVLAQLSSNHPNYHFNDIVFDGFIIKNMELKVKIKGVDGQMDQGGGFIWRFIDSDNYYVVRANPLEDNVVLYKVKNGKRTDLPLIDKGKTYGVNVPTLGNDWNTLKLTVLDDLFTVYLNGQQIFQVRDNTFTGAGKVGLWTKADAVSYFDDFKVRSIE